MQCFDNFVQCYIRISNVVDKITIQAGCVSTFINQVCKGNNLDR